MRAPSTVTYGDGVTPVLPGDRVSVRFMLRRRAGEVLNVPSRPDPDDGLLWVGVSLPDGWAIDVPVDPATGRLKKSIRLLGRGELSPAGHAALARLAAQAAATAAEDRDDSQGDTAVPARPKPIDWIAGAVAVALPLAGVLAAAFLFALLVRWIRHL